MRTYVFWNFNACSFIYLSWQFSGMVMALVYELMLILILIFPFSRWWRNDLGCISRSFYLCRTSIQVGKFVCLSKRHASKYNYRINFIPCFIISWDVFMFFPTSVVECSSLPFMVFLLNLCFLRKFIWKSCKTSNLNNGEVWVLH